MKTPQPLFTDATKTTSALLHDLKQGLIVYSTRKIFAISICAGNAGILSKDNISAFSTNSAAEPKEFFSVY